MDRKSNPRLAVFDWMQTVDLSTNKSFKISFLITSIFFISAAPCHICL